VTGILTTDYARAAHLVQSWWRWGEAPTSAFVMYGDAAADEKIAACRIFPRTIATPHFSAPAIGIGGVFVAEAYRGQGIASRMLADCCAQLAADGHLFAVLWAARHHALYARAGFVEVGLHLWVRPLRAGLAVRPGRHCWRIEPDGRF
jgi:GNAT superfamily N-acetyltransferase